MLRRQWAIVLVAWALWGSPALCVAGMLEHFCADDEPCAKVDAPCDSHDEPGCPHDDGCSHETDCSADPCADTFVRAERVGEDLSTPEAGPVAFVLPPDVVAVFAVSILRESRAPDDTVRLPLHPSDLPQLI